MEGDFGVSKILSLGFVKDSGFVYLGTNEIKELRLRSVPGASSETVPVCLRDRASVIQSWRLLSMFWPGAPEHTALVGFYSQLNSRHVSVTS